MKNIIVACLIFFCVLTGFSFGGDCANGFCKRPSGRVLSTTKSVVREVVRMPSKVVNNPNSRRVTRVR